MIKLKDILNEADIPEFSTKVESIEHEMNKIQKGVSISEREPGRYRARWSYVRRPLSPVEWTRNDYEANYEREEPAEWVPSIYFTLR